MSPACSAVAVNKIQESMPLRLLIYSAWLVRRYDCYTMHINNQKDRASYKSIASHWLYGKSLAHDQ